MSRDDIPPYLNISPDRAAELLGPPADTPGFASVAEACRRGRQDLASRGLDETGERQLRLFSTWEITRYLIPVAPAHFRRVLRQNPDLPQGQSESAGGAKWFTLDEVLRLRAHFGAEGSKAKNYLPYRPKGLPAKIVAVANFKGGVGKTSTCAHLAMSAALDGYRVLVIDLDSQGSMTSIFGGQVEDEWQTVFPLLARHYATTLRADNQRRLDRGEPPLPFDDTLTEALKLKAPDLIRKTHWPNIDLIGAQLNLYWSEFQIPVWRMQSRGWRLWDALTDVLAEDGVLDDYDLVFLDTPPALGYLTINGLAAADILLVPFGASFLEFDSTGRFFDMLHATFASIEEGENVAAASPRRLRELRRRFQLVLQDPYGCLPPQSAIGAILEEPLKIHRIGNAAERRDRARAVMAEVGLDDSLYRSLPTGLSAGQRQRLNVARAMILEPRLLIMDETLSALDQTEQGKLLDLFDKLQAQHGFTYIFISHDLTMVRQVCSRIAVMYLGETVEVAPNERLFFDPGHPYSRALLSAAPTLEERRYRPEDCLLEGEPPSPIDLPPGCAFASRCPQAFDRCRAENPALRARGGHALAACFLNPEPDIALPENAQPETATETPHA
ncbi:AAA family ATPase [Rhodovulum sulfidophilum]|nr:AAA family ATPase [Rhodovulum sulfidophilum]